MLAKLTGGLITGLGNVLKVIVLFVLVVGVARWARANPAEWQTLVDRLVGAALGVLTWVADQVVLLTGGR